MSSMLGRAARALAPALALAMGLCLTTLDTTAASAAGPGTLVQRTVAHNAAGTMHSRIVGTTSRGERVTGSFVPLHVVKRHGIVRVRGLVEGVVHHADGTTSKFAALRSLPLRLVNGTPTSGRLAASCSVLHLTLGPLDLDLLGLKVHLDRVVLTIDAQPGPGNLLGNLLCSVAGLLDGGLGGQLGTLTTLLNHILALLNLSV